jgi:hypothetical protein
MVGDAICNLDALFTERDEVRDLLFRLDARRDNIIIFLNFR